MEAGTALHAALWPYVADLAPTRPQPTDPANVANLLGGPSQMATAAGHPPPGRPARITGADDALDYLGGRRSAADALGLVGRDRANFMRATRRAETGRGRLGRQWSALLTSEARNVRDEDRQAARRQRRAATERYRRWINAGRAPEDSPEWHRLRAAAGERRSAAGAADRRRQLDTLSSMVADRGLLIRQVEGTIKVSEDERNRYLDLRHLDGDADEPSGGLYLDPGELEARYGPKGEDFYQALEANDWSTAALVVLSAFMEKYTEGATGGEPAFGLDIDLLEVEIP